MDQRKSPNVVKLFFEIDDSKAALNLDQILNDNDEMTKKMKLLESTISTQNLELQESRIKVQQLKDANKILERNKKTDDMALAAFKALKQDSMIDITRLQAEVKSLKLDLLAERQLRRIYQGKLREFDPDNEDYDPDAVEIKLDERASTSSLGCSGPSMQASDLSVEAKPAVDDPEPAAVSSSEEIPKKLVKSSSEGAKVLDTLKFPTKRAAKPYHAKSTFEISTMPSTSGSTNQFRKISVIPLSSAQGFSFETPSSPNINFSGKPFSFGDGAALSPFSTSPSTSSSSDRPIRSIAARASTILNLTTNPASAITSSSSDASTSSNAFTQTLPLFTAPAFSFRAPAATAQASATTSTSSTDSTSNSVSGKSRPTPAFTFRASSLAKATNTPATATTSSSSGTSTSSIASDPALFLPPPYSPTNPFWETFDIFRRTPNSGDRPKGACSIATPKASDR